jgi:hypothetical protein
MGVPCLRVCSGGAVAVLSLSDFRSAYTNFATLSDAQIQESFNLATAYLRNDGTSPVSTVALQTSLLYQLTAHILQLMYGADGSGASGLVGRISSASEGSVSVGADWPTTSTNAWFLQSVYGSNFWQATAAYRILNYIPGPTRFGTGRGYYPGRGCRGYY